MANGIDLLREIYEDGKIEVNGRTYKIGKFNHRKRLKVFAFYGTAGPQIEKQDLSCFDTEQYERVEKVIFENVLYEGMQLSKLPEHFDDYPEDFIILITSAMGAISYPFLSAGR